MTTFVALLRAVNVGGTAKLPMAELRAMCEASGFRRVKTYIASGNAVFETAMREAAVKRALEQRLEAFAGRHIPILVRTAGEMAKVAARNPFPNAPGNRTIAIFLDEPPPPDTLERVVGKADEEIALGEREIYVQYDEGMAHSKLRIPAAKTGTGRNMNTVAALAAMAKDLA